MTIRSRQAGVAGRIPTIRPGSQFGQTVNLSGIAQAVATAPFKTAEQLAAGATPLSVGVTSNTPADGQNFHITRGGARVQGRPVWYNIVEKQKTLSFAMLFAWNLFERAQGLLKIEVNEDTVYDATGGDVARQVDFTFYNGLSAVKDPTMVAADGEASTQGYPGRVLIVFPNFDVEETDGVMPLVWATFTDATICSATITELVNFQTTATADQIAGVFNGTNGVSTDDTEDNLKLSFVDYTNRVRWAWKGNHRTYQVIDPSNDTIYSGAENEQWEDAFRFGSITTDGQAKSQIDPGFTFGKPFNWYDSIFAWRSGEPNRVYVSLDEWNYSRTRLWRFDRASAGDPWVVDGSFHRSPASEADIMLAFRDDGHIVVYHDTGTTDYWRVYNKDTWAQIDQWDVTGGATPVPAPAGGAPLVCRAPDDKMLILRFATYRASNDTEAQLWSVDLGDGTISEITPWTSAGGPWTEPNVTTTDSAIVNDTDVKPIGMFYNRADTKIYFLFRVPGEFYSSPNRVYFELAWGTLDSDLTGWTYGGIVDDLGYRKSDGSRATLATEGSYVWQNWQIGWDTNRNRSIDALGDAGYESFCFAFADRGITSGDIDAAFDNYGVAVLDSANSFSISHVWSDRDETLADVPDAPTRTFEDFFEFFSETGGFREDFHWDPVSQTASFYTNKNTGNNTANLIETGSTGGSATTYYHFDETTAYVHLHAGVAANVCPSNDEPAGTELQHVHYDAGQNRVYELYYPETDFSDGNVWVGASLFGGDGAKWLVQLSGVPAGTVTGATGVSFLPIDGTEKAYILFNMTGVGSDYEGLVDLSSGVVTTTAISNGEAHRPRVWVEMVSSGSNYAGLATSSGGISVVVADIINDTLTLQVNSNGDTELAGITLDATDPLKGDVSVDGSRFYVYEAHASWGAVEILVDPDGGWSSRIVYAHTIITGAGQTFDNLWYDPGEKALLIGVKTGGNSDPTRKIDPVTETEITTLPINTAETIHNEAATWTSNGADSFFTLNATYLTIEGTTIRIKSVSDGTELATYTEASSTWQLYDGRASLLISRNTASGSDWKKAAADCAQLADPFLKDFLLDFAVKQRWDAADVQFVGQAFDVETFNGFDTTSGADINQMEKSVREIYGVHAIDSGDKKKYVLRDTGTSLVVDAVIPASDMMINENGDLKSARVTTSNGENKTVTELDVLYADPDADYKRQSEPFTIANGVFDLSQAREKRVLSLPLALRASQVAEKAPERLQEYFTHNEVHTLNLPQEYYALEPTDIVQFDVNGTTRTAQIKRVNRRPDFRIEITAEDFLNDRTTLTTAADPVPAPSFDEQTNQSSRYVHLDIPLKYRSQAAFDRGFRLAHFIVITSNGQDGWTGGSLYDNREGNIDGPWRFLRRSGGLFGGASPAVVGAATNVIGDPPVTFGTDTVNTLTINIIGGSGADLSSTTNLAMLNGRNEFAYGRPGRWEICAFQNVAALSDGSYRLRTLLRGKRGTEVYQNTHQLGDWVCMLKNEHVQQFNYRQDFYNNEIPYKVTGESNDGQIG